MSSPVSTGMGNRVRVQLVLRDIYLVIGQLSLAIPWWVGAVSTSLKAMSSCGWGVKADQIWFACGWQVKLLHTGHI